MERIINSVADTDLYIFHMSEFFHHRYPASVGEFTYKNRSVDIDLRPVVHDLRQQVEAMADLRLTQAEADHLLENSRCSPGFLEWLRGAQVFDPKDLNIQASNGLRIRYSGDVRRIVFWEVPLMAVISELWFRHVYADRYQEVLDSGRRWAAEQSQWLSANAHPDLAILEMGGRRRFSYAHHRETLATFWAANRKSFIGTSNVHLGMELGIPYYGTMAHLVFMFMQTKTHLALSQKAALHEWDAHFRGTLATALSDTLGNDKWDRDFDAELSAKYPWERHDSGDPVEWADRRIASAIAKGLDPRTRGLLFSDSLDFKRANDLTARYSGKTRVRCGIGTYISNTMGVPGHRPIPQVAKLTWADGLPTCKLSADPSKGQCEDEAFLAYAKDVAYRF
jgi:nicotinate phosphoribosyltransferase